MATNYDDNKQCPVCFEDYTPLGNHVPILLPCSHTLCKTCKEGLIARNNFGVLICPLDNQQYPGNQVFPENRYILENFQKELIQKQKSKQPDLAFGKCKKHMFRDLNLYCNDCKGATCELCMNKDHVGHDVIDLAQIIQAKIKNIQDKQRKIQRIKLKLAEEKAKVEATTKNTLKELEKTKNTLKEKINRELDNKFKVLANKVKGESGTAKGALTQSEHVLNNFMTKAENQGQEKSLGIFEDLERAEKCLDETMNNVEASTAGKFFKKFEVKEGGQIAEYVPNVGVELVGERIEMRVTERKIVTVDKAEDLKLTTVRTIATEYMVLTALALGRNGTVYTLGHQARAEYLKQFNLETGREMRSVAMSGGNFDITIVQLEGQDCVAVAYRDAQKIEFRDCRDLTSIAATYAAHPQKPYRLCAASPSTLLYHDSNTDHVHWLDCSTKAVKPIAGKINFKVERVFPNGNMISTENQGKRLLITAVGNSGIRCYNVETGIEEWKVQGKLPGSTQNLYAHGVTTDSRGHLFVCDRNNLCVQMFRVSDGQYLGAVLRESYQTWGELYWIVWCEDTQRLIVSHIKNDKWALNVVKVAL